VYGTTLLFRADLRDLVLPIGASWSHDSWIVNMLALCGYGGVPVLETLLLYRQHASQASGGTADPKVTDYATRVCAYEEIRKALVGRTGDGRYSIRSGALAANFPLPRADDRGRNSVGTMAAVHAAHVSCRQESGPWLDAAAKLGSLRPLGLCRTTKAPLR
jgi:hypothetical protein